jgi:fatty acid desaturase
MSIGLETTAGDLGRIDVVGFREGVDRIRAEAHAAIGAADFRHLRRIERYGRLATGLGYATAWVIPNPLSAFFLSLGQFTRWLLAHHILHRGYDRVPGIPHRYTSQGFARGWRRYVDWFDWLLPEAWDHEHNVLHHYHTGEDGDPDVAERHLEFLRRMRIPVALKYALVAVVACTWKIIYYAPNSLGVLDDRGHRRRREVPIAALTVGSVLDFRRSAVRRLWMECYAPYATWHFVIVPLLFLPLGSTAAVYVLVNKLLAEAITNAHAFLVIAPNHTADDLYRFRFHYGGKGEFYVTSVLGSANYRCGPELVDYLSIWLNYQIEHHLVPDLPMRQYTLIQPRVKALCLEYRLPYRQESVFRRFGRLLDICVGKTTMRQLEAFPVAAGAVSGPHSPSSRWGVSGSDILLESTADGFGGPQGAVRPA